MADKTYEAKRPCRPGARPSTSPCAPRRSGADTSVGVTGGLSERKAGSGNSDRELSRGLRAGRSSATHTGSPAFGQAESVCLPSSFTEIEVTARVRSRRAVWWCAARAYCDMVTATG